MSNNTNYVLVDYTKLSLKWHSNLDLQVAKAELQSSLQIITRWLSSSGLKVNSSKTEICLFSRTDHIPVEIHLNGETIISKSTINVLGVIFDSKLKCGAQVSSAITKASRALNAISLIKTYFTTGELLQLITSNFYSILYYNSEIWHIPTLNQSLKNSLRSVSAKAIKLCMKSNDHWLLSHADLHEIAGRALPERMMHYKLALQLHRTFNLQSPTQD